MNTQIEELTGSELGTKEYWEQSYLSEIRNYKSHGDVGEIWFDEDSQFRIISWLQMQINSIKCSDSIIDLGCGNGMMLIELHREGYTNLMGVDYSPIAIDLATNIAADQDINIRYRVVDLLNEDDVKNLDTFKVVHDKGTYDAVSLHLDDPKAKRLQYIRNLHKLTADDGYLIITSCNWTRPELNECFKDYFTEFSVIPAPSFKFGGSVGSVVTSIVFKKISET